MKRKFLIEESDEDNGNRLDTLGSQVDNVAKGFKLGIITLIKITVTAIILIVLIIKFHR